MRDRDHAITGTHGHDGIATGVAIVLIAVGGQRMNSGKRIRAVGARGGAAATRCRGATGTRAHAQPVAIQHRIEPPRLKHRQHRDIRARLLRTVSDNMLIVEAGAIPFERARHLLHRRHRFISLFTPQQHRDLRLHMRRKADQQRREGISIAGIRQQVAERTWRSGSGTIRLRRDGIRRQQQYCRAGGNEERGNTHALMVRRGATEVAPLCVAVTSWSAFERVSV